jgi:hypothetical protein
MLKATLTFGDRREDGYFFVNYEKRDGRLREKWASPERWLRMKEYHRTYDRKRKRTIQ